MLGRRLLKKAPNGEYLLSLRFLLFNPRLMLSVRP